MRIAIDSDNCGRELKAAIVEHLRSLAVDVTDLDLLAEGPSEYPDIGYHLAKRVAAREFERGILICGTGQGMAMIANKVAGVYAGVCHDVYSAERLRKSNDAQILTMGQRVIGTEAAKTVVSAWIRSEFEGGGSAFKVERMRELESRERASGGGR
jgi:ribose 5-phosphate isomerase B